MLKKVLVIEPFYGGSHKQLVDYLQTLNLDIELVTLPAKKWHWRARTSALFLSQVIAKQESNQRDALFCSSVLNLCELLSLRPDLACIPNKIVYFHENQLFYPVQSVKERDFQYGYNQILTCLKADKILFNSQFNLDSFVSRLPGFFKLQPDFRPDTAALKAEILAKAAVLHFPIHLPDFNRCEKAELNNVLHIVWPHRWEHDKNPEAFFHTLFRLQELNLNFRVSILGENFREIPAIFAEAKDKLHDRILHFGFVESREKYYQILSQADVVVSTSNHEFFGVAMLEAAASGCLPLVPNRLVYPEIYPKDPCIYNTDNQLLKKLKDFCIKPGKPRQLWPREMAEKICEKYSVESLKSEYMKMFH